MRRESPAPINYVIVVVVAYIAYILPCLLHREPKPVQPPVISPPPIPSATPVVAEPTPTTEPPEVIKSPEPTIQIPEPVIDETPKENEKIDEPEVNQTIPEPEINQTIQEQEENQTIDEPEINQTAPEPEINQTIEEPEENKTIEEPEIRIPIDELKFNEMIEQWEKIASEINETITNFSQFQNVLKEKLENLSKELKKTLEINTEHKNSQQYDKKLLDQFIIEAFQKRMKNDEELPLLLISAKSDTAAKGTKILPRLLRSDPNDGFKDKIDLVNEKLCIEGKSANFSYWSPYVATAQRFTLEYPSIDSKSVKSFNITAYIDNKIVFNSSKFDVKNNKQEFVLDHPISFRRITIVATNNSPDNEICIGVLKAYAPTRLGSDKNE